MARTPRTGFTRPGSPAKNGRFMKQGYYQVLLLFALLFLHPFCRALGAEPPAGGREEIDRLIRLGLHKRAEQAARRCLTGTRDDVPLWERLRQVGVASGDEKLLEESLAALVPLYLQLENQERAAARLQELRTVSPHHQVVRDHDDLIRPPPRATASAWARARCAAGVLVLLLTAWSISTARWRIRLRVIVWGLVLQLILAAALLPAQSPGRVALQAVSTAVEKVLSFSDAGTGFVFGNLLRGVPIGTTASVFEVRDSSSGEFVPLGVIFALHVLPTVIFFSALMAVLYHLGVMQRIVQAMAWLMCQTMGTSGVESLVAASGVFLGHTEAPLVVRPYLGGMTRSELAAVMTSGFAHVSAASIAAYARLGIDPGHLLIASVMSSPAALLVAKMVYPEVDAPKTLGVVALEAKKEHENVIDAAASGAGLGLRLAANIGAMLIAFIALITMLDAILDAAGHLFGMRLSLGLLFGYLFSPFAWLMGVDSSEVLDVGRLLGTQVAVNEFVAYAEMGRLKGVLSERSFTIASYALCGFCNFGSIGIQLGGIGGIIPDRRGELARIGVRAMLGGALASWLTACIAGIFL